MTSGVGAGSEKTYLGLFVGLDPDTGADTEEAPVEGATVVSTHARAVKRGSGFENGWYIRRRD